MSYRTIMREDGTLEKILAGQENALASGLTSENYKPEAIKTKITERLVQELHDPAVKGMPLYRLCAELLDRIDGKPIQRAAVITRNESSVAGESGVITIVHVKA